MNETMATPTRGTGAAVPKPQKPQWVTPEEAEKYEEMLGKNFVRINERSEGESKEYFYQVIGVFPYHNLAGNGVPAPNTLQHLVNVQVQKFYRNKKDEKKAVIAGQEKMVKVNRQVEWVELDKLGNARVLDADASFDMDARDFLKEFKADA